MRNAKNEFVDVVKDAKKVVKCRRTAIRIL